MGKLQTATGINATAYYNHLIVVFSTTDNPFFCDSHKIQDFLLFFHMSRRFELKSLLG